MEFLSFGVFNIMKIDILTLFPDMFTGPFDASMLKKAKDMQLVEINIHNLRDWATDKHKSVDDRPFGGGKGMILRVDVVDAALESLKSKVTSNKSKVFLLSPQGKIYNQERAGEMAKLNHLILIAGHYEGFDERISEHLVDEEISIGDYVLTGGEIPAMVIVDSVVRLIPGVLDEDATLYESFSTNYHATPVLPLGTGQAVRSSSSSEQKLLDYPQYTKPEVYKNWKVPEVLLSGNHKEIEKYRRKKALEKTMKFRPDLLK